MINMKSYTLLYVEDDVDVSYGYSNYFRKIFKTLYVAYDGNEALRLYNENRPDILLLDINIPYIDGLSLAKMIRKSDKDVKIIILSAYLDKEKLLKAIPLGLVQYLQKPVKKSELELTLIEAAQDISEGLHWDKKLCRLENNSEEIHLTKNEIILMSIFTSNVKEYYSLSDISEISWSQYSKDLLSEESVRNTIKRLRTKLPPNSIMNNHGIGYKLVKTQ